MTKIKPLPRCVLLFGTTVLLSGCVAAAAPLIPLFTAATVGLTGFTVYKTVQSTNGGSIGIAFPSVDGKESPPSPIPKGRRAAIWPGDPVEVYFAEKLEASGSFDVTPPSRVSLVLKDAKITSDIEQLTKAERVAAFKAVCRASNVNLVFARQKLGSSFDAGFFKLSRSNTTNKNNLMGFSCAQGSVVWREQMAIIVEDLGPKSPAADEVNKAAGEGWAERVVNAPKM